MKKLLCAATALAIVVSTPALAAVNDTNDSANVTAKIIRPISVTKNVDLAFGTIVKPSLGGGTSTVKVAADGTRSIGGGDAMALASTPPTAAKFTIAGEGNTAITVVVPANFNLTGPSTILVTTSNDLPGGNPVQTLTGTLGQQATDLIVKVGGEFNIDNSTATGDYTGSFSVAAHYN